MARSLLSIARAAVPFILSISISLSIPVAHAGYFFPGQTMGTSLNSPVPEGVYLADLETYGRADKQPDVNVGVNIPVILWSTPWTFGSNRLEFLASFPFAHLDTRTGNAGIDDRLNFVSATTWAFGPIIAHDFGNGLSGGISAFFRTPTIGTTLRRVDGRTIPEADFRESLKYEVPTGVLRGLTFMQNGGISSALGQRYFGPQPGVGLIVPLAQSDMFAGDFTMQQRFDKVTLGVTGFGNIDLDDRGRGRQASVELGGLVGYDFGQFNMTAIVTRSVYVNERGISATLAGTLSREGYETRGWLRVVMPLYVAPKAAPTIARY